MIEEVKTYVEVVDQKNVIQIQAFVSEKGTRYLGHGNEKINVHNPFTKEEKTLDINAAFPIDAESIGDAFMKYPEAWDGMKDRARKGALKQMGIGGIQIPTAADVRKLGR